MDYKNESDRQGDEQFTLIDKDTLETILFFIVFVFFCYILHFIKSLGL